MDFVLNFKDGTSGTIPDIGNITITGDFVGMIKQNIADGKEISFNDENGVPSSRKFSDLHSIELVF
ncbi:hypothetical protein [Bacillus thuringiensis]|uniref:Uncharacterized protein n=1 Tax=Bacillus thuringiensis subsp. higo TaxID=132266 RepID=A0A9X6LL98_BACUH|nr:hypothetical protein [Bacillus thuringiensis]OUB49569.1 hypothetical protein BK716_16675 [Bacillus thuringiensis serovar higo]